MMKLKWFGKQEVASETEPIGDNFVSDFPEAKPLKSKKLKSKKPKTHFEKSLIAIWVAIVGVGLAAGGGILLSDYTNAMWRNTSGKFQWNWDYESVRYFDSYKIGKNTYVGQEGDPSSNGPTNRVKYWQPFEQEYGLGYIDFKSAGLKESHICSSEIFFPDVTASAQRRKSIYKVDFNNDSSSTLYQLPWQTGTKQKTCHLGLHASDMGSGIRNEVNFVDHLGAAQYMGQRFDVREYYTAGYGRDCGNPHVSLNFSSDGGRPFSSLHRSCTAATVLEFHFYPYKTLEWVDSNFKFASVTYQRNYRKYEQSSTCPLEYYYEYTRDEEGNIISAVQKSRNGTCWVDHTDNTKKYNMYVYRNAATTISVDCPYDLDTCPPIEDYVVDSLSNLAELQSNLGSMQYIRKEAFDNMLKTEEDSIYGTGFEAGDRGKFRGVMKLDDIDQDGREGYTPLSGGRRVYLTYNSSLRRTTPHVVKIEGEGENQKITSIKQTNQAWYRRYCPEPAGHLCGYEWDGTRAANTTQPWTAVFLEFSSSSSEPLVLAYYTTGHASGISSQGVRVIYVVDDIDEYSRDDPDAAAFYEVYDNTRKYYEQIHGRSINEDDYLRGEGIDPEKVLLYFNITTYSSYDPYSVNKAYLNLTTSDLPWYKDRDFSELISVDSEPEVIKAHTIYWSRISKKVVNFPNSCYSNNTSIVSKQE